MNYASLMRELNMRLDADKEVRMFRFQYSGLVQFLSFVLCERCESGSLFQSETVRKSLWRGY